MIMLSTTKKSAKYRIFIWSAFALCLLGIWYLLSILNPIVIRYGDSVQYWAAGRLMILDKNPYSAELVQNLREQVGIFLDLPQDASSMMLYPPWTLPLVMPFGILDYSLSRLLWFLFHLVIIFFSARLIWHLYDGPKRYYWVAFLVAFTFTPSLYVLLMGHITTLHLLGIIGFLYFIKQPQQKWWSDLTAGACAALVTIKPNLLYLFMLALLFWTVENRRWKILAGGGLSILLSSAITMLMNPRVFIQFWEAVFFYPVGSWASPAIGTVIRRTFGYHIEWLQLIPTIFGLLWLIYYWIKHHRHWNWLAQMPILIFASYLTSPYMWPYDMVVLMLPILQVSIELLQSKRKRTIGFMFFLFLLINAATVYHFIYIYNYYYLFWLVPAYFVWYLIGKWVIKMDINTRPN